MWQKYVEMKMFEFVHSLEAIHCSNINDCKQNNGSKVRTA